MSSINNHEIIIKGARKLGCTVRKMGGYGFHYSVSHPKAPTDFLISVQAPYPHTKKWESVLMRHKSLLREFLQLKKIEIIPGGSVYLAKENKTSTVKILRDIISHTNFPVFVKPSSGSFSRNVALCKNYKQLFAHVESLREKVSGCVVEQYITDLTEYRVFVFKGKVKFMYCKELIKITGDGHSSAKKLIETLPDVTTMYDPEYTQENLKKHNLHIKSIIPDGLSINVHPRQISTERGYTDINIPKPISNWAQDIYRKTGFDVMGIDCFIDNPDDMKTKYIIEINSSPSNVLVYDKYKKKKEMIGLAREIIEDYIQK